MEAGKKYIIRVEAVHNEYLCRNKNNQDYLVKKFKQYIKPIATIHEIDVTFKDLYAVVEFHPVDDIIRYRNSLPPQYRSKRYHSNKFIAQQFKSWLTGYVQAYNQLYDRKGKLLKQTFERYGLTFN